jgi:hypothetical protein
MAKYNYKSAYYRPQTTQQGFSDFNVRNTMRKQYFPVIGLIIFLFGLGYLLFIPVIVFTGLAIFGGMPAFAFYATMSGIAIAFGLFQLFVLHKVHASNTEIAWANMIVPFASITLVFAVLTAMQIIAGYAHEQVAKIQNSSGIASFVTIFADIGNANPLIGTVLLYGLMNIFTFYGVIRDKEFKVLLWMLLAPLFFGAAYAIGVLPIEYVRLLFIGNL